MINQILFLLGLYLMGFLASLTRRKRIPFVFISVTGFLWGAVIWVITSIFVLMISAPYFPGVVALDTIIFVVLVFVNYRGETLQFTRKEILVVVAMLLSFILIGVLTSKNNYSMTSYDSITQIMLGRAIGHVGFSQTNTQLLSSWGVFLPIMHSASVWLKIGYLFALQPAFAFSLLVTFAYISWRALSHYVENSYIASALAILSTMTLATTNFVVFQMFYIHNSLLAATYLFVFIGTGWLALREQNYDWLFFTFLGVIGFSISRTESPLFALLFVIFLIGSGKIVRDVRFKFVFPYLFFVNTWYIYLLITIGGGSDILDPQKVLVIVGAHLAFGVLLFLSHNDWVDAFVVDYLPAFVIGMLILLLVVMYALRPSHMYASLVSLLENMLIAGLWGATWALMFGLVLFVMIQRSFSHEEVVSYTIISFFFLLLALGFMRAPFRVGWGDSANRILTHILPVILFYFLLKYGKSLGKDKESNILEDTIVRRRILAFAGSGLFVLLLFYFFTL